MFSGLHLLLRQSQAKVSSYQCHPIGSHRMVLVGVHMVNGIALLLGHGTTTILILWSLRLEILAIPMANGIALLLGPGTITILILWPLRLVGNGITLTLGPWITRTGMLLGKGTILEIGLEILAIASRMILGSSVTIVFGARIIAEPAMAKTTLSFSLSFCNVYSPWGHNARERVSSAQSRPLVSQCFLWSVFYGQFSECFLWSVFYDNSAKYTWSS